MFEHVLRVILDFDIPVAGQGDCIADDLGVEGKSAAIAVDLDG